MIIFNKNEKILMKKNHFFFYLHNSSFLEDHHTGCSGNLQGQPGDGEDGDDDGDEFDGSFLVGHCLLAARRRSVLTMASSHFPWVY